MAISVSDYRPLIFEPTKLNAWLTFLPSVVTAEMQTTMINDSMTAYSTAVGPSSFFKNEMKSFMEEYMMMGDLSVVLCEAGKQATHDNPIQS
jgi:hypothetical protein